MAGYGELTGGRSGLMAGVESLASVAFRGHPCCFLAIDLDRGCVSLPRSGVVEAVALFVTLCCRHRCHCRCLRPLLLLSRCFAKEGR